MKVAIMQPYLFPSLGYYWQLMNYVDIFVIYDNVEYTKKGWFNRNKIQLEGKPMWFTVPLKKDSDYLNVNQRKLAPNADVEIKKILRQLHAAYGRKDAYDGMLPVIENAFKYKASNLFDYILHSIHLVRRKLEIQSELIVSSTLEIDGRLRGQERVLAICDLLGATEYVNPPGSGRALYDHEKFERQGSNLRFMVPKNEAMIAGNIIPIPSFSIIHFLMNYPLGTLDSLLNEFTLEP